MTKQPFYIVDAFTRVAFMGNAAAVCIMERFPDEAVMQRIAAQMNLSETAFAAYAGPLMYDLRWFTPDTEVNLCGHATLATTHILKHAGAASAGDTVTYNTLSGPLKARVLEHTIELDFPTLPGTPMKPDAALKALGVEILACARNRDNDLVEVKDYDTLVACTPDFKKLRKMAMQGVIVTTATGVPSGFDFASRYFAPNCGIDEDPVTGSSHCFLAPYWAKKLGKESFRAYQASKGQGILDVTLKGDRTLIAGPSVITLKGEFDMPQKEKAA